MTVKKTEIKPLKSNVLVEVIGKDDVTSSGIIIPGTSQETPDTGLVIAVSEEVNIVKVGDTIMFKKWGGIDVIERGNEYLIVSEDDILAVLGK